MVNLNLPRKVLGLKKLIHRQRVTMSLFCTHRLLLSNILCFKSSDHIFKSLVYVLTVSMYALRAIDYNYE